MTLTQYPQSRTHHSHFVCVSFPYSVYEQVFLAYRAQDEGLMSTYDHTPWLEYARRPRAEPGPSGERTHLGRRARRRSPRTIKRIHAIRTRFLQLTSVETTPLGHLMALMEAEERMTKMPFGEFTAEGMCLSPHPRRDSHLGRVSDGDIFQGSSVSNFSSGSAEDVCCEVCGNVLL